MNIEYNKRNACLFMPLLLGETHICCSEVLVKCGTVSLYEWSMSINIAVNGHKDGNLIYILSYSEGLIPTYS